MTTNRIGTANTYSTALDLLNRRQAELSAQQEKLSSGLNVNRASDDPTGAAQAERAISKLKRIETDQRALEVQRNAITSAESTLGEGVDLLQDARELVVSAGSGANTPQDRAIIAKQLRNLRDQIFTLANRADSNGIALFGGLGSAGTPFADASTGVQYQGISGQRSVTSSNLPGAMDGQAIWMNVPSGNGVFDVGLGAANTGTAWTDPGTVVSPGAITGDNYQIQFTVTPGVNGLPDTTTYDVIDTTTAATVLTGQPYTDGMAIQFDGMSIVVNGAPATGDVVTVAPSAQSNVFQVLDEAIAAIDGAAGSPELSQALARQLVQFDASLERLQSARSQAGDWLNRADNITSAQEAHTIALNDDKARAVELDMVKGISDFSKMNTGYQAALQSYAQIQNLSLFNYIR